MRTTRRRSRALGLLTAGLVGGLGWFGIADTRGQLPAPSFPPAVPSVQPAVPIIPMPVVPDGNIPAAVIQPGPVPPGSPPPKLPTADYAPPGTQPREIQDAPGDAGPFASAELYQTMLREAASTRFGVYPLSNDVYAPPGYQVRDQQDGPAVPEYTPLGRPAPVTPDERLKYVVGGIVPGSYLAPGTNTSFRLRGFIRLTGIYDFSPIGSPDSFVPNTIPVPQQTGTNNNFTARPSRIAFETWTPTSVSDWNVHTFLEGDFFNGPGQAAGGGANPFRLRHAFIDWGYFRVGQQNTVFMDAQTWPMLVDFQGPAGWANQRRPGGRMTIPLADKLYWAGGIEQPFSDISTNGLGTNVQDVPDFATHLRFEDDLGHLQLSAVGRSIGYQPTNGSVTQRMGQGMSAGGAFHPWAALLGTNPVRDTNPSALTRTRVIAQYTFGWGVGRYIQDTVGNGFDGQVNPVTGSFTLPFVVGWVASYEQWLTERWLTSVTYSAVQVANAAGQPTGTYSGGQYFAANVWYIPVRNVSVGAEYLYGQRKNFDGQRAEANRFNILAQYNF